MLDCIDMNLRCVRIVQVAVHGLECVLLWVVFLFWSV